MSKGQRIYQLIFFIVWTLISVSMVVTFFSFGGEVSEVYFMAIIPMVFVVVGIVGIVSSITGKQFGSRRNGETTGIGNNQAGRPSTGRIINIWDESKTSVGKFGEETYYTYRVKFEYEDEYGKKCEQIEDVELTIYSELMHNHDDIVPIIVYRNKATLDLNKLDPMNRFKPHE